MGKAPEQLEGKTIWDFIGKKDADVLIERVRQAIGTGKKDIGDTLNLINGRERWLRTTIYPIRDDTGRVAYAMLVANDITESVEATQALRDSEEKYRTLVESAEEVIFTMDGDGRYVYINHTAAAKLGKTPEEVTGKTAWDEFPKEIADDQVQSVRDAIRTGKGAVFETSAVILGEERWFRTSLNPVRNHAGEITTVLVIARDISERKEAELALARSEERFRLTFENAVDAIVWADPATGMICNCNKAAERLLGWPRAEVVGRHFSTLHPPEERPKHEQSIATSAQGKGVSHVYGTVLTRDGRSVPVHIAASLITVGSERIVQGTFRDLTEVHQAWRAVRLSQQRLQMVVSNVPVLLLLADAEGVIQFADGRALGSLGRTAEQLVGHRILDVLQDSPAMGRAVRAGLAGQDSATAFELSGRVFNMRLSPLRSETGEITGLVGVATDITAHRKAEAGLEAARLKLMLVREEEQKRVARELHDSIGQQLVAMKISLASAGLAEQSHRCAELIQEIRRLCHDLYPPSLEALGLASAINQLGRHYEQAVKFDFEYPRELESVRFDPEKEIAMFRVAQEAVNNAVRHGKAGAVRLKLSRADGQVTLAVIDDGCGFDVNAKAGKGLGLRSMADRVHAVGGTIEFDSGRGGTTVSVRVPLGLAATAASD